MKEEIIKIFPLLLSTPKFVCKVHEDNQSCIKMATRTKFYPRTKHIALKCHHFRSHIKYGRVDIHYIPTFEQISNLLTKPLSNEAFFVLRYMLCGWGYGSKTWTRWFYWYLPFQHNSIFYPSFYFIFLGYFSQHNSHEFSFIIEMNTSSRGSVRIHRIQIVKSRSIIQYLAC